MPISFIKNPHSIFKITGADRLRYIQGRITQNIKSNDYTDSFGLSYSLWSFILSPQGKIDCLFYIIKREEEFLFISDKLDSREEFVSSLLRFKVADQVFCEDVSSSYNLYTIYSNEDLNDDEIDKTFFELSKGGYFCTKVRRGKLTTIDLLMDKDSEVSFLSNDFKFSNSSEDAYQLKRIEAGFPLFSKDVTVSIFAPDLPINNYVSFNKGCYAGQEVVEMATARGRPNRTFIRIKGSGAPDKTDNLLLYFKTNDEIKKVGFVTSFSTYPDTKDFIGLGYCKTSVLDELSEILENNNSMFFIGENENNTISVQLTPIS